MGDKLTELYKDYVDKLPRGDHGESFQAFQAGFTKSAQSMRERAMAIVQAENKLLGGDLNDIVNKIGSLSDIP